MELDAAAGLPAAMARDRDVDWPRMGVQHAPKGRCAPVADRRAAAQRQDGGHAPALEAELAVADRVNSSMNAVQPAGADASRDPVLRETRTPKLARADHAVLPARDPSDQSLAIGAKVSHIATKAPTPIPLPFVAAFSRPQHPTAGREASL